MTSWDRAFADYRIELRNKPLARAPATFGEIWNAEIAAAGLDTTFGVQRPMTEAYDELFQRTRDITGREITDMARERGLDFLGRSFDGRIDTIGKIIDSLPDSQQKLLTDYRDVRGRARAKASEIMKAAEETRSASEGISAAAVGFAAQAARQMVDPVNLAAAPFGASLPVRAGAGGVIKWLGKEFAIGATAQAVQEPGIRFRREELGLPSDSLENILTAGVGQAGLSALFKAAGAAGARALDAARGEQWRIGAEMQRLAEGATFDQDAIARAALRPQGDLPMEGSRALGDVFDRDADAIARVQADLDARAPELAGRNRTPDLTDAERAELERLSPADFSALAMRLEADEMTERMAGSSPGQIARLREAERFLEEGGPLPASAGPALTLDGRQTITRPDGSKLGVRYVVVDRADLQASHDLLGNLNPAYPQVLQPRDRSRKVSSDHITSIASGLDPDQLTWSPIADFGAPVVGPDGFVESGNGRVLALELAYERYPEQATRYRERLEGLGYDTSGMERPVLIRLRTEDIAPEERVRLGSDSNRPSVAALSPGERALVDARHLDADAMRLWQGGAVDTQRNGPFVRSFLDRAMTAAERGAVIDADGRLSLEGRRRIEAAFAAKAWGDRSIVEALFERADKEGAPAIIGAMADISPELTALRAAVSDGRLPPALDLAPAIKAAYALTRKARDEGRAVRELLDQIDVFDGTVKEDVAAAVRLFHADDALTVLHGRTRISEKLEHAVGRALMHQADLFGLEPDAGRFLRAALLVGDSLSDVELARAMTKAADEPQPMKPAGEPEGRAAAPAKPDTPAKPDAPAKPDTPARAATPDPMTARLTAALADAPDDFRLAIERADGTQDMLAPKDAVERLAAERRAVDELKDCIARSSGNAGGGNPGTPS